MVKRPPVAMTVNSNINNLSPLEISNLFEIVMLVQWPAIVVDLDTLVAYERRCLQLDIRF